MVQAYTKVRDPSFWMKVQENFMLNMYNLSATGLAISGLVAWLTLQSVGLLFAMGNPCGCSTVSF